MRHSNDPITQCPYNEKHLMPEGRLLWHLTICNDRKKKAHLYSICPYNAVHHIPTDLFEDHKLNCPDYEPETVVDTKGIDSNAFDEELQEEMEIPRNPNYDYFPQPEVPQPLSKQEIFEAKLREVELLEEKQRRGFVLTPSDLEKIKFKSRLLLGISRLRSIQQD